MLPIVPILVCFIASVTSIPLIASGNMFNIRCMKTIKRQLHTEQGANPDLSSSAQFGYIYSIDSPEVTLDADLHIAQPSTANIVDEIPLQATSVLSSVSYKGQENRFIVSGHISQSNAEKLLGKQMVGTRMQINFGVYTFDKSKNTWYRSFTGSERGGIVGSVTKMRVVHQTDENDSHQELTIELAPLQQQTRDDAGYQFLEYAASSSSTNKQINWSSSGCKNFGNNDNTFVASKRDQFNLVIESAVLL